MFSHLSPPELSELADLFDLIEISRGQKIYERDHPGTYFYILYSGKVRLSQPGTNSDPAECLLDVGDAFGEDVFSAATTRNASATATTSCLLLRLKRSKLPEVLRLVPNFKKSLTLFRHTRQLVQQVPLPWRNSGESIAYFGRRHPVFLLKRFLFPLLLFLLALMVEITQMGHIFVASGVPTAISLVLAVCAIVWGAWNLVDWKNDYFVITSQRIVWMEKVAGLFDSRQEAPLSTILSIDLKRSLWGQIMDYGDIIVKTYTSPLILDRQQFPEEVAALVEEQWGRSKKADRLNENAEIELAVKQQLTGRVMTRDLIPEKSDPTAEPFEEESLSSSLANMFKVRIESRDGVTYRKHWYKLLHKEFEPILGGIAGLVIWLLRLQDVFNWIPMGTTFLAVILIWLICILWAGYQFVDWRNDIYQVTEDQIVDIHRKPLGSEDRKTAALENILSIEYKRKGMISLLLNYGDVIISIGTEKFPFEDVYNPSEVQQDIFRRIKQREQLKNDAQRKNERTRMSEWLAAYHKYSRDLPSGSGED